jgi:uncharacterized protein DUF3606
MSTHIDINDDHELYIWARMLGVGPDELVRLVGEVGPSAERVREALKRSELGRIGGRRPPVKKT